MVWALRPMVPSATYCWLGVISCSMPLMPLTSLVTSASAMLTVRSAMTATSIGLGAIVPHEPLQATEMMFPVEPCWMPPAGANEKSTERPW